MAFQCVVVTPEQQVMDESLTQAIIPAEDGLLGILTHRAPLLAKLGKGPLRLDLASGQKKLFRIEGGIAQMKDNRLTILTQTATPQG
jgi:F-type H+-transporting ATPase subunit epsilon